MKLSRLFAAMLYAGVSLAHAAPKVYLTIDHSSASLIDPVTARALWKEHLPAKLFKIYPAAKWGFTSQVEGGFDESKTCVITARAMMLPRTGKSLIFKPEKTATTFASQAGATTEQCRALAKAKLGEAMTAVRSSLLPH